MQLCVLSTSLTRLICFVKLNSILISLNVQKNVSFRLKFDIKVPKLYLQIYS